MFKRLMIVFWGMFLVNAAVAALGHFAASSYQDDIQEIESTLELSGGQKKGFDPEDLLRDPLDNGGENTRPKPGGVVQPSNPFTLIEQQIELREKQQRFEGLAAIGFLLAAIFFLWNVLCHLAHWVWMGRGNSG